MFSGRRGSLLSLGLILALFGVVDPVGGAEVDRYLPDDTEMVLVVNIRQILEAPVVKQHVMELLKDGLQNNPETQQVLSAFGAESFKDLVRVTVALPGAAMERKGVVILHGRFVPEAIHATADQVAKGQPEVLKIHAHEQGRLYEILSDDPARPLGFAALLGKEVLVLSPSKDSIVEALAKAGDRRPAKVDKGLQELVTRVDGKQSIWVAGRVPQQVKKELGNMPQLKAFADKLQTFSGGLSLSEAVKAGFHLQMSDVQAAVDIRQTLELSKILVSGVIANDHNLKDMAPLLTDVLKALRFSQDQGVVGIELTLLDSQIANGLKRKAKP
jgi:hypothetical protein